MKYTVSIILMLLFCICQQLANLSYFSAIHLIFFSWLISTMFAYGPRVKVILKSRKYVHLYCFLAFYFITMSIATNPLTGFARVLAMMETLSPIYMFDLYCINKWNEKKYPFYVLVVIMCLNIIMSFAMIELLGGSTGLRTTIQADSEMSFRDALGLVSSLAVIIPSIVYVLKNKRYIRSPRKRLIVILSIAFALWAFVLVMRSYFMIAIVTTIIGSFFALIYSKRGSLFKGGVVLVLSIFLFLTSFNFLVSFVDGLSYGASSQITPKLYELKYFITGESHNAEDFSTRINLAKSSLNLFFKEPIFGVSYKVMDFEETVRMGVGNHSEWVDSLALYGVFSFFLFSYLYRAAKKYNIRYKFFLPMILFCFSGFNNPILSFSFLCNIFLLVPMFLDTIEFKKLP